MMGRDIYMHSETMEQREARLDREGGWKPERKPIQAGDNIVPGVVTEYGVLRLRGGLPVSRTLPLDTRPGKVETLYGHKVRVHKDGTVCDLQGRRIIASKSDAQRAESITGFVRD